MPESSALRALNGFDVYRILARLRRQLKENVRKALRKQGFSAFTKKEESRMRNVYDCVVAFEKLLNKEYHLILGRKGIAVSLQINFGKKECFHSNGASISN